MHNWTYNGSPFDENLIKELSLVGFVYVVHNLVSNKKYIGKKLFFFKGFKKERGKKRKRILVESDWKTYHGSSEDVQKDVKTLTEKSFAREILYLCKSKAECSYFEAKTIFETDALRKPDAYYNLWISARVRRAHLTKFRN